MRPTDGAPTAHLSSLDYDGPVNPSSLTGSAWTSKRSDWMSREVIDSSLSLPKWSGADIVTVGEMIRRWEHPEKRARRLEVFGGGVRELKVT